jgi:hypothetical protein
MLWFIPGKTRDSQSELMRARGGTHLFAERAQLFCINPIPYAFHVIPVGYDAVFHGVLDLQQPPEFLGFPAYENVSLKSTRHNSNVLRPSDTGIERELPSRTRGHTRPEKGKDAL